MTICAFPATREARLRYWRLRCQGMLPSAALLVVASGATDFLCGTCNKPESISNAHVKRDDAGRACGVVCTACNSVLKSKG